MEVYLDNSATTKPDREVIRAMARIMEEAYGNPSSMHILGVNAERVIRDASEMISNTLKCKPSEILFTSGGTESDNIALIGAAHARRRAGRHIITTRIEHPAVLETCRHLSDEGYEIDYLDTDAEGVIKLDQLEDSIREDTILVSIMHTNNEIGSLQPIAKAGEIIKRRNPECLFHTDAVQGYTKASIIPRRMGIDLMSVSAHKFHGPRGTGFLYIKDGVRLEPQIYGGGQQKGMRSGTENTAGIYGMAVAAGKAFEDLEKDLERLAGLKSYLVKGLSAFDGVKVNGVGSSSGAPHIVSASFEGIRSEVLLHALEDKGIYVSSGSACSSNRPHISETLKAIGLPDTLLDSTIRFSASRYTTAEELDYTLECLGELLPALRRFTRR